MKRGVPEVSRRNTENGIWNTEFSKKGIQLQKELDNFILFSFL